MKTTNTFYKILLLTSIGVSLIANDDENLLTLEKAIELSKNSHFEQKEILEDINLEDLNLKKLANSHSKGIPLKICYYFWHIVKIRQLLILAIIFPQKINTL